MGYIDSHCHLDLLSAKYGKHVDEFNYPAQYQGCVANFAFPQFFGDIDHLSRKPNVWITVGVHPKYSGSIGRYKGFLEHYAAQKHVVGIGETGLDSKTETPFKIQRESFVFQVELARFLNKPLVLHCRGFSKDVREVCQNMLQRSHKIHLHCFTESQEEMQKWCDCFPNLKIGVTNLIHNDYAYHVHTIVKNMPLDRLVLETDAPHFLPSFKSNTQACFSHPGLALNVAVRISQIKSVSVKRILKAALQNTIFVYNLKL